MSVKQFGNTEGTWNFGSGSTNSIKVSKFTVTESMKAIRIAILVRPTTTGNIKGLVYTSRGSTPDNLLYTTPGVALATSTVPYWAYLPFTEPVSIGAGDYWIGIVTSGAQTTYQSTGGDIYQWSSSYASPSTTFSSGTLNARTNTLYIDYYPAFDVELVDPGSAFDVTLLGGFREMNTDVFASDSFTQLYSRTVTGSLPTTDAPLATLYSDSEYTDVATDDTSYVDVSAGPGEHVVHQFQHVHTNNTETPTVTWIGKCTKAPSETIVYLQAYNYNTDAWVTVDSDNATAADTEFTLTATLSTDYYNSSNVVTCRVTQSLPL